MIPGVWGKEWDVLSKMVMSLILGLLFTAWVGENRIGVSIVGALEMAEAASEVPVGLTEAEMEQLRGLVDYTEGLAEEGVEAVMREFMEEAGGVERDPVLKEGDALYGRRREAVDRRGEVVQSKPCKAILKRAQNWEKKRWKLTDEMEELKYEKRWLTLERLDMRKLADRVRERRVKREEKMRF